MDVLARPRGAAEAPRSSRRGLFWPSAMGWWVLVLLVGGCAAGPRNRQSKPVYQSAPNRPGWITNLPASDDEFYATGFATGVPSLEEGKRMAATNAMAEISDFLGFRVSVRFEGRSSELFTRVMNEISKTSSAKLARTRIASMYYEQRRDLTPGKAADTFDVFVLLRIPKVELEKERARLERERAAQRDLARDLLKKARKSALQGRIIQALQGYCSALEVSDRIGDLELASEIMRGAHTTIREIDLSFRKPSRKARKFPKKLVVRARLTGGHRAIALPRAPLLLGFREGSGAVDSRLTTDADGNARATVARVASPGRRNVIEAKIDTRELQPLEQKGSRAYRAQVREIRDLVAERRAVRVLPVDPRSASRLPPPSTRPPALPSKRPPKARGKVVSSIRASHRYYVPGTSILVAVQVDLAAPRNRDPNRLPLNVALVMDTSGSMGQEKKLAYTKQAAGVLIDNLDQEDSLAFVTFGTKVKVVSPVAPVKNRMILKHQVERLGAKGTTNLSGGMFEGYAQVSKAARRGTISRIILLSDGLANAGVTDGQELIRYARDYAKAGVAVTTVGIGNDYNEDLLMALAESSNGNYYYVRNPEDIPGIFEHELSGLLAVAAQNIRVDVDLSSGSRVVSTFGTLCEPDLDRSEGGRGPTPIELLPALHFSMGDLVSGREKVLVVAIRPPERVRGKVTLAEISLSYDDLIQGRRVEKKERIVVRVTDDARLVEGSLDQEVIASSKLFELSAAVMLAVKHLDEGLHQKAYELLRSEYQQVKVYADRTRNPMLLERIDCLRSCLMHLETLSRTGQLKGKDGVRGLRKDLQYKGYQFRHGTPGGSPGGESRPE